MKRPTRTVKRKLNRAHRKPGTSAGGIAREVIRTDMKKMKEGSRGLRKLSANGTARKNGATGNSANAPVFKHPGTTLEAAIQRYVDLFDFAPIGYVSFDALGDGTKLLTQTREPVASRTPFE